MGVKAWEKELIIGVKMAMEVRPRKQCNTNNGAKIRKRLM